MKQPSVSIICPVYNVAQYIARCAHSLLAQTLENMEFIFVDDCSPDDSIEILKRVINDYPNRQHQVKIIHHEKNLGLARARNTGIKIAIGEYIAHCDSDDWVNVDMYEKLYNKAITCDADIVGCDYDMYFCTHIEKCETINPQKAKLEFIKLYIASGWTVLWNLLIKNSLYIDNNIYCFDGCDFGEDYGVSVRLLTLATKYVRVSEPLYHYNRTNVNSVVRKSLSNSNINKTTDSLIKINSEINKFFISLGLYNDLMEELSWRMLAAKRGWLYQIDRRIDYLCLFPESNKFIMSNPFCSAKDKLCQKIILRPKLLWILTIMKYINKLIQGIKLCRYKLI